MTHSTPYYLIDLLKNLPGAINYDGECSVQVVFKLSDGKYLRIGITDSDVVPEMADKYWCDILVS